MPRRSAPRRLAWLVLPLLLGCGTESAFANQPAIPRSALLITLDTVRADHLEPYGGDTPTPALRRLSTEGALFEKAYATTPVTLPSHASIMTGLDPPAHGVRNNGSHYLGDNTVTLAQTVRDAGFRTAAFVSAAVLDRRYGLARGFELYDDDLSAGTAKEPGAIAERRADTTVDAARAWLDTLPGDARFLLWVHLFDPHIPYAPPAEYAERFAERPYDGEIAFTDAEIGRLLSHPRLAADEVAVMVIGDHGEGLGEHGEPTHGMLAYDSTLRIPWIVRLPGGGGGARLSEPVSQVDLLPTLLEILGVEPPAALTGRSLATALALGESTPGPARSLYAETLVPLFTYGWAPLRTVRRDGWKLIAAPRSELYDLDSDPAERHDLSGVAQERLDELELELVRLAAREAAVEESPQAIDAATERQLRALGYLSARGSLAARRERPDPKDLVDLHRLVQEAEYHLARLELEAAERRFRSAIERDPENVAATFGLARTLGEQRRFDDAEVAALRAVELAPADASLRVGLAAIQASGGDTEEALATLETALTIDARSLDARVAKARYLAGLGRRREAVALLEEAIGEGSAYPRLEIRYAELVELPDGRLESAERRLREALRVEPYLADGWRILGQVLEAQDRGGDAEDAYRLGLAYQPGDSTLHEHLGLLLARRGELDSAALHLETALSAHQSAAAYDGLASIANRRGEWPRAEEMASRALAIGPDLASAWNNLAIAREEQLDLDGASSAYERALAIDRELWQARFNYGLLLRKMQRFDAAANAFQRVLETRPDHAGAHYELGLLYTGPLQDLARARAHLEASLAAEPAHPRSGRIADLLTRLSEAESR